MMDQNVRDDLEGLTEYIIEGEYEDFIQQLITEPSYEEEGLITPEEVDTLAENSQDDQEVVDLVDRIAMNPEVRHIYALALRLWKHFELHS